MKSYVITFAGVPGTSKTPIAYHLSVTFNLPMYCNDNVRYEVKEDLLVDNINAPRALAEYEKRTKERGKQILNQYKPIILDSSVDRHWLELRAKLKKADYNYFIISMDLSRQFIENLYIKTGRRSAVKMLDHYLSQHSKFLNEFKNDVGLHITDEMFKDRLRVSSDAVRSFLRSNTD